MAGSDNYRPVETDAGGRHILSLLHPVPLLLEKPRMIYRSLLMAAVATCLTLSACTSQAWYEGAQQRQRQECYRHNSPGEAQKCLDQVEGTSYGQYSKQRQEATKPSQ